jgi:hypothetical protein
VQSIRGEFLNNQEIVCNCKLGANHPGEHQYETVEEAMQRERDFDEIPAAGGDQPGLRSIDGGKTGDNLTDLRIRSRDEVIMTILSDCADEGLESVMVIGFHPEKGLFLKSSVDAPADVLYLIEAARHGILRQIFGDAQFGPDDRA